MSQIIIVQPNSKEAHWLMSLKINDEKSRIGSCVNKIGRLYGLSQGADINAILTLYDWYCAIRQVEGYFDKEIARLSKLIRRKVKDKFEYEPFSKASFRLRISNPVAASFYRILNKFDTLMCLSETCMSLSIFKKRRLFAKKTEQYKCSVMRVITLISQHHKLEEHRFQDLNQNQRENLNIAIHADVMPLLAKAAIESIQENISSTNGNEGEVQ